MTVELYTFMYYDCILTGFKTRDWCPFHAGLPQNEPGTYLVRPVWSRYPPCSSKRGGDRALCLKYCLIIPNVSDV